MSNAIVARSGLCVSSMLGVIRAAAYPRSRYHRRSASWTSSTRPADGASPNRSTMTSRTSFSDTPSVPRNSSRSTGCKGTSTYRRRMPAGVASCSTRTSSNRLRLVRCATVSRTWRIESGAPVGVAIRPEIDWSSITRPSCSIWISDTTGATCARARLVADQKEDPDRDDATPHQKACRILMSRA